MSTKKNYRRRKSLSPKELERRRIAREQRKERKRRKQRQFMKQFWAGVVIFILLIGFGILFGCLTVQYDSNALVIYLGVVFALYVFLSDRSGIRSFAFQHYPGHWLFSDALKKEPESQRSLPVELARTFGYISMIPLIADMPPDALWAVIWSVCILIGFYYVAADPRYSLAERSAFDDSIIFVCFSAVLCLKFFRNFRMNEGYIAFTIIGCAIVLLLFLGTYGIQKDKILPAIITLIFTWLCFSAMFPMLNKHLDFSEPRQISAIVEEKQYQHSSGRYSTSSYYIYVDDWAVSGELIDIQVTKTQYDAVSVGDRICIAVAPGALGAEHYQLVE